MSDETPQAVAGLLVFLLGWMVGIGFYGDVVWLAGEGREPVLETRAQNITESPHGDLCSLRPDGGLEGFVAWLDCELGR